MADGARKDDAGKAPVVRGCLSYFPRALTAVATVSQAGFEKYGEWAGWRRVPEGQLRYTDALGRHMLAEGRGETYDVTDEMGNPGTRCLHAALLAWNALARLDKMLEENPLLALRLPSETPRAAEAKVPECHHHRLTQKCHECERQRTPQDPKGDGSYQGPDELPEWKKADDAQHAAFGRSDLGHRCDDACSCEHGVCQQQLGVACKYGVPPGMRRIEPLDF